MSISQGGTARELPRKGPWAEESISPAQTAGSPHDGAAGPAIQYPLHLLRAAARGWSWKQPCQASHRKPPSAEPTQAMGSSGVERLQGAHYGRKEPRGQVPAAGEAADTLRPAEPSKPVQLLHTPITLIPLGSPPPCSLPGQLRRAAGTLSAAAQLSAGRGPDPPQGHCIPARLKDAAPRLADGGPASHAHSGTRPACVHTDTHTHTRTHEWLQRRGRRCGTDAPQDSEHPAGSHCAAPDPVPGNTARHPAGDVAAPGAPVGWKSGCTRGSGWDPAPPSGTPQRRDHRGSPSAGSPRPQHLPRHPPSAAWLLRPGHHSRL